MSYIETLLNQNNRVVVPCQTDIEYKITSNQCSWCAGMFVLKYIELKKHFLDNKDLFIQTYKECLEIGTQLRKDVGTKLYGENIDNLVLLDKFNLSSKIFIKFTFEENTNNGYLDILPDELKSEFYSQKHLGVTDFNILLSYKFSMVSRHGLSFALITIGSMFLVLDPHAHTAGLMTSENAFKYIKYEIDGSDLGCLYITILCGV